MSKIGIVTFHFVDNHGAVLQAAALSRALVEMGHDPFVVDYTPDHVESGGRIVVPRSRAELKGNIKTIYLHLSKRASPWIGNAEKKALFETFRQRHFTLSPLNYRSLSKLSENPPEADFFVTGSDQVWNKSIQYGFDPAYFLQFGGIAAKRVSYAPSFGKAHITDADLRLIGPWLGSLDAISVRENSGGDFVKRACGRDAVVVPDPTFLVDPQPFVNEQTPDCGDYVFSYALRTKRLVEAVQGEVARRLNVRVVAPQGSSGANRYNSPGFTVGPSEWLALLKRSRFVVTNSFHGTAFSILFRKPFITVALPGAKSSYNERARNLLDSLGLQDRMIDVATPETIRDLVDRPIDWSDVSRREETMRAAGKGFLRSSVG